MPKNVQNTEKTRQLKNKIISKKKEEIRELYFFIYRWFQYSSSAALIALININATNAQLISLFLIL